METKDDGEEIWKDMCWLFNPGETGVLVDTKYRQFYVYAENENRIWEGNKPRKHELVGQKLFFNMK
eukprot:UN02523